MRAVNLLTFTPSRRQRAPALSKSLPPCRRWGFPSQAGTGGRDRRARGAAHMVGGRIVYAAGPYARWKKNRRA